GIRDDLVTGVQTCALPICHVSLSDAQWTLTAALLSGAVATPIVGRFGGNRRRRGVIIAGLLVVVLGTLLAALPLGFGFLLAGRADRKSVVEGMVGGVGGLL